MIKLSKLRNDVTPYYLVVDVFMIWLVVINLGWIIFDWMFSVPLIQQGLSFISKDFVNFYASKIHPNFFNYDLLFVAVFLTEFFIGWGVSIVKKRYSAWWHYPFFHWYDILGCIPAGSFRFLRVLRVISLVIRLHRLGVMDLSNTAVYRFFYHYYSILVEEVSDRVVVNVLDGIKEEVAHGHSFQDRLIHDVLMPRNEVIVNEIVKRTESSSQRLLAMHQSTLRDYIAEVINQAMHANTEMKMINYVPIVGGLVNRQLDHAVGDIVANVVEQLIADLSSPHFYGLVQNYLLEIMHDLSDRKGSDYQSIEIIQAVIDLLKEQVKVQRWKERES